MPTLASIVQELLATGFANLDGARASVTLPITERQINDAIAAELPPGGAVRALRVRPRNRNRFNVEITLGRLAFLPIPLTVAIERQAQIPDSPFLVVRLPSFPGLISAAHSSAGVSNMLPAGVMLDGDRVKIDLRVMMFKHGLGELWPFIDRMEITTIEGRVVIEVAVHVNKPNSRKAGPPL